MEKIHSHKTGLSIWARAGGSRQEVWRRACMPVLSCSLPTRAILPLCLGQVEGLSLQGQKCKGQHRDVWNHSPSTCETAAGSK